MYHTLEHFVGNTPLVKLKRLSGNTTNTILAKLEGNNPAGSVKDRPALSMVVHAEERGEIKAGDTLIEATSGKYRDRACYGRCNARNENDLSDARTYECRTSPNYGGIRGEDYFDECRRKYGGGD